MGDSLSVMSTSKRPKEAEIPIAVNRVFRDQRGGAGRQPEDMHVGEWLQSGVGNNRSFHEVFGSRSLHNGLSKGDLWSLDQHLVWQAWVPYDVPIEEELTKELMR